MGHPNFARGDPAPGLDGCNGAVAVDVVDRVKAGGGDAEVGRSPDSHIARACSGLGDDAHDVVVPGAGRADVRRRRRRGRPAHQHSLTLWTSLTGRLLQGARTTVCVVTRHDARSGFAFRVFDSGRDEGLGGLVDQCGSIRTHRRDSLAHDPIAESVAEPSREISCSEKPPPILGWVLV